MTRLGATALVGAGLLIAVSPVLEWFAAPLPAGTVTARGLAAAGELGTLIALGLAVLASGVVVGRLPPSHHAVRWSALGAALAALLAFLIGVEALVNRPALVVVVAGGDEVATGVPVTGALMGPAAAFSGAALAVVAAALVLRSRRGRGGRPD